MFLYQNKMSTLLKKKLFYFVFYFIKNQYFATGNWLLSVWHSRSLFFSSCDLGVLPKRCSGVWVYTTTENGSLRIDTTESWHAKNINSSNTIPVGIILLSISFEAKLLIGHNFDILFCSKYFHNFKLPLHRKMRVYSSHYDSS